MDIATQNTIVGSLRKILVEQEKQTEYLRKIANNTLWGFILFLFVVSLSCLLTLI